MKFHEGFPTKEFIGQNIYFTEDLGEGPLYYGRIAYEFWHKIYIDTGDEDIFQEDIENWEWNNFCWAPAEEVMAAIKQY